MEAERHHLVMGRLGRLMLDENALEANDETCPVLTMRGKLR
jgi:hypothetical protein